MCGIAGIVNLKREPITRLRGRLEDMGQTIVHRGPDSEGFWLSDDKSVGLMQRRLAIVDLSEKGAQPMPNEDKTVWITFNGEIYNHADIRTELEKLGHVYRSHSDTETIIHAYEQWG